MRRIALVLGILLLALFGTYTYLFSDLPPRTDTNTYPSPTPSPYTYISVDDRTYAYLYTIVDPSDIRLLPNFEDQVASQELIESHGCRSGINGGFYSRENTPIGLFVADRILLQASESNDLFDTYLSISGPSISLSFNEPTDPTHAVQTGPMLIIEYQPRSLQIRDDMSARRMLAATSGDTLILMSIFTPETVGNGPTLETLPDIVAAIDEQEALEISYATNLDGGSASAFWDGKNHIAELTPIGSFFCVQ